MTDSNDENLKNSAGYSLEFDEDLESMIKHYYSFRKRTYNLLERHNKVKVEMAEEKAGWGEEVRLEEQFSHTVRSR